MSLHAAGRQTLQGHLPKALSSLASEANLPGGQRLPLAISLPPRNPIELNDLIQALYNPASPNYGQYLTPGEFTAKFGPTEEDCLAVVKFAQANGLTVKDVHPNRLVVDVDGSVADIEKAFHVTMKTYSHPSEARKFFAPTAEPSVDLAVPLLHISGLDNYSIPRPNHRVKPSGGTSNAVAGGIISKATPNSGSSPTGAYGGGDFRAAYVPGTTLTGSGQRVGLLQFDGYYASDIAAYRTQFGLPNIPLIIVPVDGGVPNPGSGNGEVCLDIEMVMSMAPGISSIYIYEAPNPSPWVDLLSKMANDNLCKQLSCSWGGGSPDPACEVIFQQMATQGQSFFNATGDSDAFTGSIPFPSDSPNITEVGATTLTTSGAGGTYVSETVWNWGTGVGSSGGSSNYYSIPTWQRSVSMATNQGSTTMRNVPDVALVGDNIYVCYNNGSTGNFGGTSCAAPLWAAFIALVNQQALSNGRSTVGFLNSTLYALGSGANFHDITTGNNFSTSSPSKYSAVTGYDLCTGWGTPTGTALITSLAGPADGLQVTPSSSFAASGLVGGAFVPPSGNYQLINHGASSLTWRLSATQSWLSLSATNGTLLAGGSASITATINAGANSLASGSYSDTLTFLNVTSGISQTRPATLTVTAPAPILSVTSTNSFSPTGSPGGPFNPSADTLTVSNTGSAPMTWAVSNTTNWLKLSSTGGTLAAGGSTTIVASLSVSATNLVSGTYTDAISFVNVTSGKGNSTVPCLLKVGIDYFTQLFATGSNNTAFHTFTFIPNAMANHYFAHSDPASTFPSDPTGGTRLSLGDDAYAAVTLTGTSVSLYGTTYSKFYVGSNGYITFTSGDTSYKTSLTTHFKQPRISGLFLDLNPAASGTVSWKQLTDRAVVTFQNVPVYNTSNYNSFQFEMFFNGKIRITVLSIASTSSLIGLSQGLGTPSGFVGSNFSTYPLTDLTPPVLTITTPATPTTTSQPAMTLQGTATDASGITSVVANGVPATTSDAFQHWSATVGALSVGLNSITVVATDGAVPANTTNVTRQVLYYTSTSSLFGDGLPDAWKIANGLDPFSGAGVNSAVGNPSGDGISNLMKYAINLNPQRQGTTGLPFTSMAVNPSDGQNYLIFNYRRLIGTGGLTYSVEASSDLETWDSSSSNVVEIASTPDPDGVTDDVQVRVEPSLSSFSSERKFIRLRVTAP